MYSKNQILLLSILSLFSISAFSDSSKTMNKNKMSLIPIQSSIKVKEPPKQSSESGNRAHIKTKKLHGSTLKRVATPPIQRRATKQPAFERSFKSPVQIGNNKKPGLVRLKAPIQVGSDKEPRATDESQSTNTQNPGFSGRSEFPFQVGNGSKPAYGGGSQSPFQGNDTQKPNVGGGSQSPFQGNDNQKTDVGIGSQSPFRQEPIRPARPSHSSAGEETFELGNGAHVPRSVGGVEGHPDAQGGVTYDDGRRATPGPKGSTVFYNPDGSIASVDGAAESATESHSREGELTFTLINGQKVPRTINGENGTADSRGGVTYSDGRRIYVDPDTGETVSVNADGSEQTRTPAPLTGRGAKPAVSSEGELTYELENGQQVPQSANGQEGTPDKDGGVTYTDGRRVYPDRQTGETVVVDAEGNEVSRTPAPDRPNSTGAGVQGAANVGGTVPSHSSDGTETYTLDNGEQVPRANVDGSPARLNADGSVTFTRVGEDGQIETSTISTTEDGMTVIETEGEMTFKLKPGERQANAEQSGSSAGQDGHGSNSGSNNGAGSDDDSDSESNDDSGSDDDSGDSNDDGGDDSDSGDDSGGDDGGDTSGGDDGDSDGGASENRAGAGSAGGAQAPGSQEAFCAANPFEPECKEYGDSEPCDDSNGTNPVMEPGVDQNGNCVPGSNITKGEEDDEESGSSPPNVDDFLPTTSNRGGNTPQDWVTQPGVDEQFEGNSHTFEDALQDIEGVVNPGQ